MAETLRKNQDGLKDYLALMAGVDRLSFHRKAGLLEASRCGDAGAYRELTEAYLPLVVSWVASRRGEALSFQELIGIGNAALMENLRNYQGPVQGLDEAAQGAVHEALDAAFKLNA